MKHEAYLIKAAISPRRVLNKITDTWLKYPVLSSGGVGAAAGGAYGGLSADEKATNKEVIKRILLGIVGGGALGTATGLAGSGLGALGAIEYGKARGFRPAGRRFIERGLTGGGALGAALGGMAGSSAAANI